VVVLPGTYSISFGEGSYWPPGVGIVTPGLNLIAQGPPGSVQIVGVGTIEMYSNENQYWPVLAGIAIWADNVHVEGFAISGFPTGIGIGPSDGLVSVFNDEVDQCTINGCVNGIFLSGSSPSAPNWQAHIHDNQVNNQMADALLAYAGEGSGILVFEAPGCHLDHNECNNNANCGIGVGSSPNCTVDNNTVNGNASNGIFLEGGASNCEVGNNQANDNGACGIQALNCPGSTFINNAAQGNAQYDFAVQGCNVTFTAVPAKAH